MSSRRWFVVLGVLFAAVVVSGVADRQREAEVVVADPGVCEESLKIGVIAVRASKGEAFIDPEIASFAKHLALTGYTGFAVVDRSSAELLDGEHDEFQFGLRRWRVDLKEHDGQSARLRLRLFGGDGTKALDTVVSVHRNRTFMVAGPKVGDDVLILPVTVVW